MADRAHTTWQGSGRRTACIIVAAADGDVRAARGLIGRAIRKALKVRRWDEGPHYVHYRSVDALVADGAERSWASPRYLLDVTDPEMDAVSAEIRRLADREGWTCPPVDIYHD